MGLLAWDSLELAGWPAWLVLVLVDALLVGLALLAQAAYLNLLDLALWIDLFIGPALWMGCLSGLASLAL